MNRLLLTLLPVVSLACTGGADRPDSTDPRQPSVGEAEQPATGSDRIVDAAGVSHMFPAPPTRIISLIPSVTETLVAIGATELILARTDFDDLPEIAGLPSIGAGLQPNLEAILEQGPDLVVYFSGSSDEATPRRLGEAGIRTFAVRPDRMNDVRKSIRDLGQITNRSTEAAALLLEMDSTMAAVMQSVRGLPGVRTVFSLGGDPPWVAGPNSYVSELITAAGGVNVFSDIDALYGPASLEEFLIREIDVVLMGPEAEASDRIGSITVRRLPAYVALPGPRLHLAARAIAEALHPAAFK
jgi:cobalamin transport system substrate-binding protein